MPNGGRILCLMQMTYGQNDEDEDEEREIANELSSEINEKDVVHNA